MASYQDNKRGIVWLTSACALFTVNDAITKIASFSHPIGEVLFIRSGFCLIIIAIALYLSYRTFAVRGILQKMVLLRAVLDAGANVTFITALSKMRLADIMALGLLSPLLLTMFLAFFFKEPVGWRRWSAIGVGVIGMLLIVKPGASAFDAWALVGLSTAFFSSTRDIVTRRIDPAIPTLAVTTVSLTAVTLSGIGVGFALGESWTMPSLQFNGMMVICSLFLAAGSFLAVGSFRNVDATLVAPFRYSLLIWSGLAGYFMLGEVSDAVSVLGAALIVASGLYTLHRERVRHRALTAAGSAIR